MVNGLPPSPLGPPTSEASAVALRVANFLIQTEEERFRLFHLYLQATVRRVSPLLLDFVEMESMKLDDLALLIKPPENWPWRPMDDKALALARSYYWRKVWLRTASSRHAWQFKRTFINPGVIVREANHPNGRLAIRPCNAVLGFTAGVGPCILSVYSSSATLKLPDPVPEIVMASLPGMNLGSVVDHPIFTRRRYIIKNAEADPFDFGPLLTFSAQLTDFVGPWKSGS